MPGRVELWPFLPKPERDEEPDWDVLPETAVPDDPVRRLADRIAGTVAEWLATGRLLPGEPAPRPIRAGDVLILVQRRGPIFDAVIRALKRARVPVAGADLLRIGGDLAVRDLLAALRFAATRGDDLSLAAFLRSPLGGVSERALFDLAHGRPRTLWEAFRSQPADRWPEARALLDDVRAQADFLRPFELIERMLIRHRGRERLVARLGAEAEDGIDALLDQALAYEQVEPPSLTGFLDWIDRDEVAVKRRSDAGVDQVRVMTVHGAKGLEAPIVFLPDTAVRSEGGQPAADGPPRRRDTGLARSQSDEAAPAVAAADGERKQLLREENRRLLYVALTRAKRWLVVCGAGPQTRGESWHGLVEDAMRGLGATTEPDGDGETLSLSHNWSEATAPRRRDPARCRGAARLGDDRGRAAARARAHPLAVRPRRRGASPRPHRRADGRRPRRGPRPRNRDPSPARAPPRRTATRPARPSPRGFSRTSRTRTRCSTRPPPSSTRPELAFLFDAASHAEVDVSAPMPGGRIVGRIDRLVIEPGRVLAIDFKSNRARPRPAGGHPRGHPSPARRLSRRARPDLARPYHRGRGPLDPHRAADARPPRPRGCRLLARPPDSRTVRTRRPARICGHKRRKSARPLPRAAIPS